MILDKQKKAALQPDSSEKVAVCVLPFQQNISDYGMKISNAHMYGFPNFA